MFPVQPQSAFINESSIWSAWLYNFNASFSAQLLAAANDPWIKKLIVFRVTAPLLTVGVQVDLPESSADSLPEETEPLTLSINAKGEIFIQEAKVEYDNIIAKVLAVSKNRTDTRIYVRGDKTINYGRVLEIMGLLSGSGFTKVALISEPYKQR